MKLKKQELMVLHESRNDMALNEKQSFVFVYLNNQISCIHISLLNNRIFAVRIIKVKEAGAN